MGRLFIPNLAAADPVQGNKSPDAGGDADLFDNPHTLLGCFEMWRGDPTLDYGSLAKNSVHR